ncbi:MAG: bifunctional lysylphosphatidylglycerol flippase/synthetase MprF, partial [Solirubrobacterales bacterium]
YSAWGLSAAEVTQVVAFGALTLGLGFLAVAGASFLIAPFTLRGLLDLPLASVRPLGVLLLVLIAGYLLWCTTRKGPIRIRGWQVQLPSPALAFAQIFIASLDWAVAAAVLYVLLPPIPALTFAGFLGAYLLAAGIGVVSHVPGGLGVFETTILVLLPPDLSTPAVLGAVLAYRAIYYLLPLGISAVLLGTQEILRRPEEFGRVAGVVGRWVPVLAPHVFALTVFVGGAILLFSGAMPAADGRLDALSDVVPLPFIEASHFLASLIGAALLLLARGLQRRLDAAYALTLILLGAGILFSLLKGFDYEEALVLTVILVALWPCKRFFYRRSSLIGQRFTAGWVAAIVVVLVASFWLGLFSYKHVAYVNELWWQVALEGSAPRSLRASVGVVAVVLGFAIAHLLRPAPPEPARSTAEELDRAAAIAARSPKTEAYLALLGDKELLFSRSGNAFLMYGVAGRSWVSMSDPVGPQEEWPDLAWRFRELSDRHGGRTVFYEVSAGALPLYLDLGLTLLKIGEEARVPLGSFSLEGGARKELRYVHRRLAKAGCAFEFVPPGAVAVLLPDLQAVSDAWLGEKNVHEKGFSLGRFDPEYLRRFPAALIRREGRVIAFANLWLGAGKAELSIDLMRHLPEAPHGVMDGLFIELMLWGRREGYGWFNLGMAPLSGLEDRPLAPAWNRLGAYLFRHGEHFYNFQGLRKYKEKFDPAWEPRYLAAPGGPALPRILLDVAALISGGLGGIVAK